MARPIMINLRHHLASQIQIHFEFDSPLMLISEFTFDSHIVQDQTSLLSLSTNQFSIYVLICISIVSLVSLSPLIIWLFYRIFSQRTKTSFLSSSSSISSTEFNSRSSSHRYASIASSSYGKVRPTANFLRLPNRHFEGICGNSSYATERAFSMNFEPNMFRSIEQIRIRNKLNNRYQLLGGGEVTDFEFTGKEVNCFCSLKKIYQGELQIEQSSIPISIRRILPNASIESKYENHFSF